MSIWLKNTSDEINISDAMKKNITLCSYEALQDKDANTLYLIYEED